MLFSGDHLLSSKVPHGASIFQCPLVREIMQYFGALSFFLADFSAFPDEKNLESSQALHVKNDEVAIGQQNFPVKSTFIFDKRFR